MNLLELNDKKLDRNELIKKTDKICEILNNDTFRTTFNTSKLDKNKLYGDDKKVNTKLLLGKLNTIFDDFGIQLKYSQKNLNRNGNK